MKKILALILIFVLALTLAACETKDKEKKPTAENDQGFTVHDIKDNAPAGRYVVSLGDKYGVIDEKGATIIPFEYDTIGLVNDYINNDLKYIAAGNISAEWQKYAGDVDEENDIPELEGVEQYDYTLFDTEGEEVCRPGSYPTVYNNLYTLSLWDKKTKNYVENIYSFDSDKPLLTDIYLTYPGKDSILVCTNENSKTETIDNIYSISTSTGEFTKLDLDGYVPVSENPYADNFVAQKSDNETYKLIDGNGNALVDMEFQEYWYGFNHRYYVLTRCVFNEAKNRDDRENYVWDCQKQTLKKLAFGGNYAVKYYDGKNAICHNLEEDLYYLGDVEGNILTEGYSDLINVNDNSFDEVKMFCNSVFVGEKEGWLNTFINGEGQVVFTEEINTDKKERDFAFYIGNGIFNVHRENYENPDDNQEDFKTFLQNSEGERISEKYQTINSLWQDNTLLNSEEAATVTRVYALKDDGDIYDILDLNGKVVLKNLKWTWEAPFEVYDGYRIVVQKGFSYGLMDMKGNWIWERSIFDSIEQED